MWVIFQSDFIHTSFDYQQSREVKSLTQSSKYRWLPQNAGKASPGQSIRAHEHSAREHSRAQQAISYLDAQKCCWALYMHRRCNVGLFSFPRWPYCTFLESITFDHPHSFTSTTCTSCLLVIIVSIFCMLHPDLHFPCGSAGKESAWNAGDLGSIPGLWRSPGEGKGYPLQYSCLENSMDCIVHGVSKSRTRLSNFHFTSLHGWLTFTLWLSRHFIGLNSLHFTGLNFVSESSHLKHFLCLTLGGTCIAASYVVCFCYDSKAIPYGTVPQKYFT